MATYRKRSWKWLLVLAGALAAMVVSGLFDDPAPAVQRPAATPDGYPAMPPAFSWDDMFRVPPH